MRARVRKLQKGRPWFTERPPVECCWGHSFIALKGGRNVQELKVLSAYSRQACFSFAAIAAAFLAR